MTQSYRDCKSSQPVAKSRSFPRSGFFTFWVNLGAISADWLFILRTNPGAVSEDWLFKEERRIPGETPRVGLLICHRFEFSALILAWKLKIIIRKIKNT